ncbi:HNH endonuclease [Gordonia sp. NPDC003429]
MFDYGSSEEDLARIARAGSDELCDAGVEAQRLERQACARKIMTAVRVAALVFDQVMDLCEGRNVNALPEKAALREVSIRFGVSVSVAGKWIALGEGLRDMPVVLDAFLDGDLSEHKARILTDVLECVPDDKRDLLLDAALSWATAATTGSELREKLDEMVIAFDPELAAEQRREFAKQQDVRIRKEAHGHWNIDAMVPLEDGMFAKQRLAEIISRSVCSDDPRPLGQQRVAALGAMMRGESSIPCACGRDDCRKTPHTADSDAADSDTADSDTADSDTADSGHRRSAHRRLGHRSALDGALGRRHPGGGQRDRRRPHTAWQALHRAGAVEPGIRKGRPRRAGTIAPTHLVSGGPIVVRSRPPNEIDLASLSPIDPSGHGGLQAPTPGALVYQPGAAIRREVHLSDRRCRGPFCDQPASSCQLDHVVPFDHENPLAGGWTIPDDLIPLCIPCHQVKHLGIWIPTLYPGRIVVWRHRDTGEIVVTHP